MSSANDHSIADSAAVTSAQPVVLLRYRPGVAGEAARVVHLVPLRPGGQAGAAGVALCGAVLCPDQVKTVAPGHGMPCSLCVLSQVRAGPPPPPTDTPATAPPTAAASGDTGLLTAAVCYRMWGWPVTLRGDQVWLNLEPDTVALIIPVLLATQVIPILTQRRCPPLALIHPDTPDHQIVLAGEPYGVVLPWPPGVQRATVALPLPPTMTARGPITWVDPPEADALRLCREIDVFAALRTALRDSPT
ncbi:MAG: hypothetical protein ACRDRY_11565 [Pseudonocardiaceae bacterium]